LELPEKYFQESPSDKLVSTTLAAIAEFETARRLERQLQGIEAAKKKNNYKGRKTVINNELIQKVQKYYNLKVPVTEIARITGRSRSTI
jgi:DNA invertase Pin-like site-specific DNA recombinase